MAITITIHDDDVLTHALVWCKNSEGRFGWYDTVDEKFYDITDEVVITDELVAMWERNLVRSHFIDLGISPMEMKGSKDERISF